MTNAMKTTGALSLLVLGLASTVLAQDRLQTAPSPAASGPAYDVSLGYSYLTMPIPGAGRVNLNGLDASGQIHLSPRWGAIIDSGYAHSFNVPGTPHDAHMVSLQGGPMFYPVEHGNTPLFVHLLAGGTLEDGAVPISRSEYFHGWLLRPSYAAGAGFEHSVSGSLALRVNGDYLRTRFFDAAGAVQSQSSLRMTVSLVFRLRRPYGGRH